MNERKRILHSGAAVDGESSPGGDGSVGLTNEEQYHGNNQSRDWPHQHLIRVQLGAAYDPHILPSVFSGLLSFVFPVPVWNNGEMWYDGRRKAKRGEMGRMCGGWDKSINYRVS